MKQIVCLIAVFCSLQIAQGQQLGVYQHGTVVKMRMGDCLPAHHGFAATIGGPPAQMTADACPEYTLISDKVVFVIVGKSSNQLIPLADVIDFRFHKSDLAVRLDDAKHESKFSIKEMILRSEWDLVQKHIVDQLNGPGTVADGVLATQTRK